MRMPPPHFRFEGARHGLRVEFAPFLSDHDLERQVQQQIAQLVAQLRGLAVLECLIELQRFFDQIRAQRLARLGVVPGAARPQVAHQCERAGEGSVVTPAVVWHRIGHRILLPFSCCL